MGSGTNRSCCSAIVPILQMKKLNVGELITYPVTQPVNADWDSKQASRSTEHPCVTPNRARRGQNSPRDFFLLSTLVRYQYKQLPHVWLFFLKLDPALLYICVARGIEQQEEAAIR